MIKSLLFILQYINGFEMPDDANVDCYYDAFKENNLTAMMIDERALRKTLLFFYFLCFRPKIRYTFLIKRFF